MVRFDFDCVNLVLVVVCQRRSKVDTYRRTLELSLPVFAL
jgi:hypothetical protein